MMHLEQRFTQALHVLRHHRLHAPHRSAHEVYQSSTINALLEGVYDGDMTCGQLRRHGDFGIGTFNALDGEMIGFDGHFWQIRGDGRVHPVPDAYRTPFATVLFFNPRIQHTLEGRSIMMDCVPWWTVYSQAPICSTRYASMAVR